jgi:hypothetical protein
MLSFRRGDVIRVDLNGGRGVEKTKVRPCGSDAERNRQSSSRVLGRAFLRAARSQSCSCVSVFGLDLRKKLTRYFLVRER